MLTRKERILQERINLKDFKSFLDEYCEYIYDYKNCDFLRTHQFEIKNSRLEFLIKCPRGDNGSVREIILMKKNDMWYENCDHALIMMHNSFDNNGEWDWSWQIVDYRIGKRENIDKSDIFKNVLEFMIEHSKGEESIRMKREHKLKKLNI
jgi:hypothetical protein